MKLILIRLSLVCFASVLLSSCVGVMEEDAGIEMELADERASRQLNKAHHEMQQGRYYYARELTLPLINHKTAGREATLMMKKIDFHIKFRNIKREQKTSAEVALNDVEKRLLMPDSYNKKRIYVAKVGPFMVEKGPAEKLLEKPVDVDLTNADIAGVLEALRQVEGLNFIADEGIEVANSLTIKLKQVPLRDILGYIERNMGLKFYVTKDVVWVMSSDDGEATKGPRLETKIIHLKKGYIPDGGGGGGGGGGTSGGQTGGSNNNSSRTSSSRRNNFSSNTLRNGQSYPNGGTIMPVADGDLGGLGGLLGGAMPDLGDLLGGGGMPDLGNLAGGNTGGGRTGGGGGGGGSSGGSSGGGASTGDDLLDALNAFFADTGDSRPEGAKFQIFRNRNILIIRDSRENLRLAQELIEAFDRDPMQVIIETRFVTVSQTDLFSLGAEINQITKADRDFPDYTNPDDIRNYYQGPDGIKGTVGRTLFGEVGNAVGTMRFAGILDNWMYDITLSLLKQMDSAQTLDAPRVTVVNNRQAHIRRGTTYQYYEQFNSGNSEPVYDDNNNVIGSQATLVPQGAPQSLDEGLTLDVTPSVGNDGKSIALKLSLQNTGVVGFNSSSVSADGQYNLPEVAETEIETTVIVGNGETVVMGGTIKHKIFEKEKKIPILGDIPIIGALFRKVEKNREPEHLLIFVTAHVLDIDGRHKLAVEKEDAAREAAMRLKEEGMIPENLLREDLNTSDLTRAAEILRRNGISPENVLKDEPKEGAKAPVEK